MAEIFPAALQELLNQSGFQQTLGDTLVRSTVEVGPAKVRSRFTKAIDTFNL